MGQIIDINDFVKLDIKRIRMLWRTSISIRHVSASYQIFIDDLSKQNSQEYFQT